MNINLDDADKQDGPPTQEDPLQFMDDEELEAQYEHQSIFEKLDTFLQSEEFVDECRQLYSARV